LKEVFKRYFKLLITSAAFTHEKAGWNKLLYSRHTLNTQQSRSTKVVNLKTDHNLSVTDKPQQRTSITFQNAVYLCNVVQRRGVFNLQGSTINMPERQNKRRVLHIVFSAS